MNVRSSNEKCQTRVLRNGGKNCAKNSLRSTGVILRRRTRANLNLLTTPKEHTQMQQLTGKINANDIGLPSRSLYVKVINCDTTKCTGNTTKKSEIAQHITINIQHKHKFSNDNSTDNLFLSKVSEKFNNFIDKSNSEKCINFNFCEELDLQTSATNFKVTFHNTLVNIHNMISEIDHVILNGIEPRLFSTEKKPLVYPNSDSEPSCSPGIQLLPKTKWAYHTPNKQRIRRMEELNFHDSGQSALEPLILQRSKKAKTLYEVKGDVANRVNVHSLRKNDEIPINMSYMKQLCCVKIDEDNKENVDVNQFLVSSTEETIDITRAMTEKVQSKCKSYEKGIKRQHSGEFAAPSMEKDDLNWYERRMKLLATCRPEKTCEKVNRLAFLRKKSLSFQEEPFSPRDNIPEATVMPVKLFKSFDSSEQRGTEFETDFTYLENDAQLKPEQSAPSNQLEESFTGSDLSYLMDNVEIGKTINIPVSKFYSKTGTNY